MNAIFKKLNYKDQKEVYILNPPDNFLPVMEEMKLLATIKTETTATSSIVFFLVFVTKQKEVDDITNAIIPLLKDDAVLWFAYPKGSSKRYKCEFNRDTGWNELGNHGYEGVRMVAIDEDWSALRFRKAEHIKTMTRSFAMSETGKQKVAAKKATKK